MIDSVLKVGRSQLGYRENPPGSNRNKYGEWYGVNGQPWCAMFISWVYHQAGSPLPVIQAGAPSGAAYCPYIESFARNKGQWFHSPQPGDLALFHFGKPLVIHIGIVESVNGSRFSSIEGNTSVSSNDNGGAVMRRSRNTGQVRGFYRPLSSQGAIDSRLFVRNLKLTNPYMRGDDVRRWQQQAVYWGMALDVDGVYGPESEGICKILQDKWGLEVDGIVGPKTWARTFTPSSEFE